MTVNKPAFVQLNKIESFNFGFGDRAFYGIVLQWATSVFYGGFAACQEKYTTLLKGVKLC